MKKKINYLLATKDGEVIDQQLSVEAKKGKDESNFSNHPNGLFTRKDRHRGSLDTERENSNLTKITGKF